MNDIATEHDEFVLGVYLEPTIKAFLQQSGRLSDLARAISKDDLWLYRPPEKVAIRDYFDFMLAASELSHTPYLGLLSGQLADLQTFDLLGSALGKASNLATALQKVMVLERLVHRLGGSSVQVEGSNLRLIWRSRYQAHPASQLVSENVLAGIVQLAQKLTGRSLPVIEMTYVHAKPDHYQEAQYLMLCQGQCRFSQPYNSLLIAQDVLAWPLILPNNADIGQSPLKQKERRTSFIAEIREILAQRLVHNPKLAQIAALMGCSERSLQRQLQREGQSFQKILADVRFQQACDYLQYSTMSFMQISQMLGFREQSSFNHFFAEQSGLSPSQYRKQIPS